jgi:hypothetical protein
MSTERSTVFDCERLKLGESRGQAALWTGSDSEAYFANLKVK